MKIKQNGPFQNGYNSVTALDGAHSEMLMDYGILKMEQGQSITDEAKLEKLYVLLYGEISVECEGQTWVAKRDNFLDNDFWLIDVPAGSSVKVTSVAEDSEVAVVRTENEKSFPAKVHDNTNSVIETRGVGYMNDAGTRIVKTMMDHSLAPESNIMIGEDVHYPGKWSGFPSHSHNQPEIYYYKFYPENGFGLLKLGDEGVMMEHNDTILISPDLVHPQVSAPGYAMYYLWIIRHLDGNPYIKPNFEEQHLWVEQPGAKYWPEI